MKLKFNKRTLDKCTDKKSEAFPIIDYDDCNIEKKASEIERSISNQTISRARSAAVKLAEDVEGGDEADKAEAHNKDDGGADLQSGGVIGVEPEHIDSGTGGRDSGAAQGHAEKSRPGCRGRRCLVRRALAATGGVRRRTTMGGGASTIQI
ncbi:hypothetical protein U1Q18_020824 [Sarracenia purpurea var. burkii]